jgi:thiol-disulfide isomerase/thioredoxin
MLKRRVLLSGLALVLALAACAPATAPTKTPKAAMAKSPEAMPDQTPDAMVKETPRTLMDATPDAMMKETPQAMLDATTEALMEMPAWFSATLSNAATADSFTIQDFKGKVVLVETMAIWCSTCLRQQQEVKALHEQLGERDDFVSVGIDIDLNENVDDLKAYTAKNGFDWTYTVATPAVAREIGNRYGQQFLNPPSAPMFIIDRQGAVHPLPFGVKSAADLHKALEPFLNEAM